MCPLIIGSIAKRWVILSGLVTNASMNISILYLENGNGVTIQEPLIPTCISIIISLIAIAVVLFERRKKVNKAKDNQIQSR